MQMNFSFLHFRPYFVFFMSDMIPANHTVNLNPDTKIIFYKVSRDFDVTRRNILGI